MFSWIAIVQINMFCQWDGVDRHPPELNLYTFFHVTGDLFIDFLLQISAIWNKNQNHFYSGKEKVYNVHYSPVQWTNKPPSVAFLRNDVQYISLFGKSTQITKTLIGVSTGSQQTCTTFKLRYTGLRLENNLRSQSINSYPTLRTNKNGTYFICKLSVTCTTSFIYPAIPH